MSRSLIIVIKPLVVLLLSFLTVFNARSEFRIWEDVSGRIWEGEFQTLNAGKIVVIDRAGKRAEYSPDELSENDLSYLEEVLPPRLSLDVAKMSDSRSSGKSEMITCRAAIKKTDNRSYKGKLTAVLVLISEETRTGAYSKAGSTTQHTFTLMEKHGLAFEFESNAVKLMKRSANSGRVYAGYILVVWDRFGNPVAVKSNRDSFLERATKIARPKADSDQ